MRAPTREERLLLLNAGTAERRRRLHREIARLASAADGSVVLELLQRRRLLPLLGPRLLAVCYTPDLDEAVTRGVEEGRRRAALLDAVAHRTTAKLTEAGIASVTLKGPALSETLYGDAGRRPSSDVDILVRREQLHDAVAVVRSLGYCAPLDMVDSRGMPLLHFALAHERGTLPPIELHWRVHWYEERFAGERLLPPPAEPSSSWQPRPVDELTALLLFYARDGFTDLRLACDLAAWWDRFGGSLSSGALDAQIASYPALSGALRAATLAAKRAVGLPLHSEDAAPGRVGLRGRIAVRLPAPHPRVDPPQLSAQIGLVDGLLAPRGGLGAFVRRQVLPDREVVLQRARCAGTSQPRTVAGHATRVLARYMLAIAKLRRWPAPRAGRAVRDPDHSVVPQAEAAASGTGRGLRIAYLCSLYPAISHTFVLREVESLRARGAEIATFSIRRAGREHLLSEADRGAFESTYTILPARWATLLGAHVRAACKAPVAYMATLVRALRLATPGLRGHVWQIFYFAEAVVLWDACSRRGLRHVHAHMGNVASDTAMLASRLGTALEPDGDWSWSLTLHGPDEFFDVSRFRLAEKVGEARFVVCISDYTRSQLMTLSDPSAWHKLYVNHVGIPIEQFTRRHARQVAGDPTVLFVGRHVPQKGHAVLLEAARLLADRGRRVRLVLAGEGPQRPKLEELAARLELAAQVSFPGAVGQEDIRALYEAADAFCLPSFAEGVPTVLMEAMAMELPVISTRINGVPELVEDGRTGLLVSPGRSDELADAVERLLADPHLCRELGKAAREKVSAEFNVSHTAARLHDLLQAATNETGRSRPRDARESLIQ